MREIVSPFGLRSPFGQRRDAYKVLGLKPPLVADFVQEYYRSTGRTTFDGLVTHAATSNATMVDSDGVLKWRPHNLAPYSEDYSDAAWNAFGSAISGTSTATLTEDTSTGYHYLRGTAAFTVVADDIYTIEVEAQDVDARWLILGHFQDGTALTYSGAVFDLSAGTLSEFSPGSFSVVSSSITATDDGYFICKVQVKTGVSSSLGRFHMGMTDDGTVGNFALKSYTGTSRSLSIRKFRVYRSDLGGMVNNPDRGDSYVPTTSAVYLPRRGHHVWDGSAWVNEGLLHESEARTNLEAQSDGITSWGADAGSSLSQSSVQGQDNSFLTELDEGTGTSAHRANKSISSTADTEYTYSAEIAPGTARYVLFGNNYGGICIDTVDGVITETIAAASTTTTNGDLQPVGNGHWRASVTVKHASITTLFSVFATANSAAPGTMTNSFTGTNRTALFGLFQVEQASTPSSYIPTSGSQVTRAAETLTIPAANLPWSSSAVSIQMEGRKTYADEDVAANNYFVYWHEDGNNNIHLRLDTQSTRTGQISVRQEADGETDTVSGPLGSYSPGILVPFNIASRHGSTFINGAVDGTALTEDTTPVALPDLESTDLDLGYDYMGTIKTFRMWAADLGDTGIAEASSS